MVRIAVAVIGPAECEPRHAELAEEVGRLIVERGGVVVTGGGGGVMEAASRGAHEAGGTVVGILPGTDPATGNRWVDIAIPTGMGELRNGVVVSSASAVIAISGEWGTMSEIALARKAGKPVIGLHTWRFVRGDGEQAQITTVQSAKEAVAAAFDELSGCAG
jgi:uncharacterized protein (TIGR00725 family)